jgi:hypothetical protein
MRDFRDAKAMAQTLREALNAKSVSITHSESLELVAKILGFHDWNVLAAKIQSVNERPVAEPDGSASQDNVDNSGKPARQEVAVDAAVLDAYVGFLSAQRQCRLHGHARRQASGHAIDRTARIPQSMRRATPNFLPKSSTHRSASSLT